MLEIFLGAFARPFLLLVLTIFILFPVRYAMTRFFPEGRIKRLLLWRLGK